MIERDASSLREGDAASGATRRRKSPFLKQTHFTRRRRCRAFHPRCRRRYLARQEKKNEKLGVGIKADERTEAQQQACVAASATVALLRYICRRDEKNAKYGWGLPPDQLTDEQQQACVSASSTVDACS